jgi:hypothetical protein
MVLAAPPDFVTSLFFARKRNVTFFEVEPGRRRSGAGPADIALM